jgi:hypothetical protein
MTDRDGLPHERVRLTIFWILILTWPAMRIAGHISHLAWLEEAEDAGSASVFIAFVLGRWLYFNTQRNVCQRLDEVERCWQLVHAPPLELIRGDRED